MALQDSETWVDAEIRKIVGEQNASLRSFERSPVHPSHVAASIMSALFAAERAIARARTGTSDAAELGAVWRALEVAHMQYRMNQDDEDGYGSATFSEMKAGLEAVARRRGLWDAFAAARGPE